MNTTGALDGIKRQMLDCINSAYDKGVKDAKKGLMELTAENEYKHGLNDAEKARQRIYNTTDNGGLGCKELCKIFGDDIDYRDIFENYSVSEVVERLKKYDEEHQEDKAEPEVTKAIELPDDVARIVLKAFGLPESMAEDYDISARAVRTNHDR